MAHEKIKTKTKLFSYESGKETRTNWHIDYEISFACILEIILTNKQAIGIEIANGIIIKIKVVEKKNKTNSFSCQLTE